MAYYPSCISDSQICNNCYASQSCTNCGSSNSPHSCSSFCNSGCNTICNSSQAFCSIGIENINSHSDVPKYTPVCQVKDEIIIRNWTAVYWNSIRTRLLKASTLGAKQPQGAPPAFTNAAASPPPQLVAHPPESLITAEKYNQVVDNLNHFGAALTKVAKEDVIKAAHSVALNTGNTNAKFKSNVCDVCNAGSENRNNCNCACQCSCGCDCGCGCNCSSR